MTKDIETKTVYKYIGEPLVETPKTSWDMVIDDKGKGLILISITDWQIVMGRLRGETYAAIGEYMGLPPSTVQYRASCIGITKAKLNRVADPKLG